MGTAMASKLENRSRTPKLKEEKGEGTGVISASKTIRTTAKTTGGEPDKEQGEGVGVITASKTVPPTVKRTDGNSD
jgi:hypothetical protein